MDRQMMLLDLGCGTSKVKGAIGVDVVPLTGVDLIGNLSERPYPFADNSFDAVYLNDVIEHIPNTIRTMEEVYRILKPDGRAYIRVVNWNSIYTAMDPTHLAAYTENSFDFFGKRVGRSYYTRARFDVVEVKRGYNQLARRFCNNERLLYFFARFFSNVLEDLHFDLRAVKPAVDNETTNKNEALPGWFRILRCPVALREGKPGQFRLLHNAWLICDDSGCKYPLNNGLPRINDNEAQKWAETPVDLLPVPSPEMRCIPVEDKPIETISQQIGQAEITSPKELVYELIKTYFIPLPKYIFLMLLRLPRKIVRGVVSLFFRKRIPFRSDLTTGHSAKNVSPVAHEESIDPKIAA